MGFPPLASFSEDFRGNYFEVLKLLGSKVLNKFEMSQYISPPALELRVTNFVQSW